MVTENRRKNLLLYEFGSISKDIKYYVEYKVLNL
jgi:hypothetical protein